VSDVTRIPDAIGQGNRQAAAKLIKLQYFVGLLIDKGVERLGISPATANESSSAIRTRPVFQFVVLGKKTGERPFGHPE